jgi:hypothetical protein
MILGARKTGGVDHHQSSSNIIKHPRISIPSTATCPQDGGAARGRTGVALLVRLAAQLGGVVLAGDEQIQVQQNLSGLGAEGEE